VAVAMPAAAKTANAAFKVLFIVFSCDSQVGAMSGNNFDDLLFEKMRD
jgi:hypothetical protein